MIPLLLFVILLVLCSCNSVRMSLKLLKGNLLTYLLTYLSRAISERSSNEFIHDRALYKSFVTLTVHVSADLSLYWIVQCSGYSHTKGCPPTPSGIFPVPPGREVGYGCANYDISRTVEDRCEVTTEC